MGQLLVRNLEETVVKRLRQRAARRGFSMEEEHRRILRKALLDEAAANRKTFKQHLLEMPDTGEDADFRRPKARQRRVDL